MAYRHFVDNCTYRTPPKAAKAPTMMAGHAAPGSLSGFLRPRKPMMIIFCWNAKAKRRGGEEMASAVKRNISREATTTNHGEADNSQVRPTGEASGTVWTAAPRSVRRTELHSYITCMKWPSCERRSWPACKGRNPAVMFARYTPRSR